MSKPEPIEYELDDWRITYCKDRFDVGKDGPDPVSYRADIRWTISQDINADDIDVRKDFRTFKEAVAWIEAETGLGEVE